MQAFAASLLSFTLRTTRAYLAVTLVVASSAGCGCSFDAPTPQIEGERSAQQRAMSTGGGANQRRAEPIELIALHRRSSQQNKLLDPAQDGWESERFAEVAKVQLRRLIESQANSDAPLTSYAEADAVVRGMNSPLALAFEQPGLRVYRGLAPASQATLRLSEALTRLLRPLQEIGVPVFHFKVVRVDIDLQMPMTVVLYESFAAGEQRAIQQTARMKCRWASSGTKHPKLHSLVLDDLEQVVIDSPKGRWFDDCTATVLSGQSAYHEQFVYGLNHWTQRIERAHQMDDSVRNGLAIGDANGDGLDDVYVCQGPGLPNRLLIQNADGTVTDMSRAANVDWLDQTSSALFVDLNNDAHQDLAIATFGGLLIMENSGSGSFTLQARLGSHRCDAQSLSAADYDNDGDLDLYLCVYRPEHLGRRGDFIFHNATTGGRNYLFRNDCDAGEWGFADVTDEAGLGANANRYSLAAAWEDFDQDGDQDLYVANDYGPNELYRNDGGRFSPVTANTGLSDTGFGMSVSWGDVNRDGRIDLYIGNMFSSAGNRITRQAAFQANATPQQRALYQRMARGNSLFLQQPDGSFVDQSLAAGVNMGRWAWSSVFADVNNDSWQDLLVANGYITTDDPGDL